MATPAQAKAKPKAEPDPAPEAGRVELTSDAIKARVIDATDGPQRLVQKIAIAMAEAGAVTKSSTNSDQGYKYASVEQILEATRGPLLSRGIALFQHPAEVVEQETTSSRGTKGSMVTVKLNFTFTDGEEDYEILGWAGQGIDYGDKAYGKAYTNAIKTFIRAQWMLPTGDDPESDSPERGSRNGGPPAWAAPANAEQKEELVKVLTGLLHGNQRAARSYAKILADTVGAFPTIVAAWLCALPAHREAARTGLDPDPTPAEAAEGDVAAQEASGEPEPAPAGEAELEPDTEGLEQAAPEDPPADERTKHAAGSLENTAENREHCTCEEHGTMDEKRGHKIDDACPLEGHGIPF